MVWEPDSSAQKGLLRELNPGPLAPEARIIPLDQAADADGNHVLAFEMSNDGTGTAAPAPEARGGRLRRTGRLGDNTDSIPGVCMLPKSRTNHWPRDARHVRYWWRASFTDNDAVDERSKEAAQGAIPKGCGFDPPQASSLDP